MTSSTSIQYSKADRRHLRHAARISKIRSHERELHLIDIENVLGDPRFTAENVARFRTTYLEQMHPAADAQFVIATSSRESQFDVAAGWPGARTMFRLGHDGADYALISVALDENIAARYSKVVFATSDQIFADVVTTLRRDGLNVAVVAGSSSVSRNLAASAAGNLHHLSSPVRTLSIR